MKNADLKILAFTEGAAVLLIQLLGAQMMAPYFGSGITTWGCVIGSSSIGLAIGYLLAAKLSPITNEKSLFKIALYGSVLLSTMPSIAKTLIYTLLNTNPTVASIIIAILLISIPVTILSTIPVLIINQLSKQTKNSGKHTGNIYSISSLGGIASLLIAGFFTIPQLGLTINATFFGLAFSIFLIFQLIKRKEARTLLYLAPIIPILFIQLKTNDNNNQIHQSEGLMGQIVIRDDPNNNTRGLYVNRMGQTLINKTSNKSLWEYPKYIYKAATFLPKNSEILLLGLGGGTIASELQENQGHNVTAIEIDKRIPFLAKKFFNLSEEVKITIDDGRHYLETTKDKYNLIIFDAVKGETPPNQLLSIEAIQKAESLLSKNGLIIINFNGYISKKEGQATRAIYHTLKKTDLKTLLISTGPNEQTSNCLFLCSKSKQNQIAKALTTNTKARIIEEEEILKKGNSKAVTDDKPNLEILNRFASKKWREGYNQNLPATNQETPPVFR